MKNLTKNEKSLLLFFETAYVDFAGKLNPAHMNDDDRKIADRWNKSGYVKFGRVSVSATVKEVIKQTMLFYLTRLLMMPMKKERQEPKECKLQENGKQQKKNNLVR